MSRLFIVSTPIGNLEDITFRAVKTLSKVDLILAEDTRQTKKLLTKYDINTPLKRFDAKKEAKNSEEIIEILEKGKDIALVSDAGTPGISDPGALLIKTVREKSPETKIIPIPGPSSLTAALSISGLKSPRFEFLGFLPHKKGRKTLFEEISSSEIPVVFFESPHRLIKTLSSLKKTLGKEKRVQVFRELTKIHEEVIEGNANEVLKYFEENPDKVKGEIVIIVRKIEL